MGLHVRVRTVGDVYHEKYVIGHVAQIKGSWEMATVKSHIDIKIGAIFSFNQ